MRSRFPHPLNYAKFGVSEINTLWVGETEYAKDGSSRPVIQEEWEELTATTNKLANIVYAAEVTRSYPQIVAVLVHSGVGKTGLVKLSSLSQMALVYGLNSVMGVSLMDEEQGCLCQLWVADSIECEEFGINCGRG
ncbi:hypothetical protein F4801DRAFT_557915 [Xylaria longipes]|nr:hypothetical protein F4801DRAFT_557915 [Xylaria longipes]